MMQHTGTAPRIGTGPKAVPQVSGEEFSTLINLSGRRRFTSQRVVLFAVLAEQGREGALAASEEALASFVAAHAVLVRGDARCPGIFCEELRQAYYGASGGDAPIQDFIGLAQRVHGALQSKQPGAATLVDQLVESATPLLAALNRLTQVYEDLSRRHAARSRKQLLDMMSEIQAIAKQARIVAFNAQIVASRAQGAGREFSVVSAELSHVTSRIDELVREALRSNGA
jgi:hypothetical protein